MAFKIITLLQAARVYRLQLLSLDLTSKRADSMILLSQFDQIVCKRSPKSSKLCNTSHSVMLASLGQILLRCIARAHLMCCQD